MNSLLRIEAVSPIIPHTTATRVTAILEQEMSECDGRARGP